MDYIYERILKMFSVMLL